MRQLCACVTQVQITTAYATHGQPKPHARWKMLQGRLGFITDKVSVVLLLCDYTGGGAAGAAMMMSIIPLMAVSTLLLLSSGLIAKSW
jgi:hypothetical protein